MQFWKGVRIGLVSTAVIAAMAAMNTYAGASGADGSDQHIEISGGTASFYHFGDKVECVDNRSDGYGVRAYGFWIENDTEYSVSADCWGKGEEHRQSASIPEGSTVWLQGCYIKTGVDEVRCSQKRETVA